MDCFFLETGLLAERGHYIKDEALKLSLVLSPLFFRVERRPELRVDDSLANQLPSMGGNFDQRCLSARAFVSVKNLQETAGFLLLAKLPFLKQMLLQNLLNFKILQLATLHHTYFFRRLNISLEKLIAKDFLRSVDSLLQNFVQVCLVVRLDFCRSNQMSLDLSVKLSRPKLLPVLFSRRRF